MRAEVNTLQRSNISLHFLIQSFEPVDPETSHTSTMAYQFVWNNKEENEMLLALLPISSQSSFQIINQLKYCQEIFRHLSESIKQLFSSEQLTILFIWKS